MNHKALWAKKGINQRTLVKLRQSAPWMFWYQAGQCAPETVLQRKLRPFTLAHVERHPLINRDAQIYTIGSCFARNIEEHLLTNAIRVLSREIELPDEIYSVPARPNAILNQYSTPAILGLVAGDVRVFEPVPVGSAGFAIPCASALKTLDLARAEAVSLAMQRNYASMFEADCVIITLGQNESWYDHELGIHWTAMPPAPLLDAQPDRFTVECHNFSCNFENIASIVSHLHARNRQVQIVLTVSPVPLHVTFSQEDALVSNEYNKSVLRAIAEEIARTSDRVTYFPSYEMVLHSRRENAYMSDLAHVQDSMVAEIMKVFFAAHVE